MAKHCDGAAPMIIPEIPPADKAPGDSKDEIELAHLNRIDKLEREAEVKGIYSGPPAPQVPTRNEIVD